MAIGTLKAGANSQDVTASTGADVVDTVNFNYKSRSYNVATLVADAAAGSIPLGVPVSTKEYHAGAGVGGNTYQLIDGLTERPTDDGGSVIHVAGGSGYLYLKSFDDELSVQKFGGLCDGEADDTNAFLAALQSSKEVVQKDGIILVDSLTVTNKCNFKLEAGAEIKLKTPAVANAVAITLSAENSYFYSVGVIDANYTSRSVVAVTGSGTVAIIEKSKNLTADAGSAESVSILEINADNCVYAAYGENCLNTGQTNESVPRIISVQNGSDGGLCHYANSKDSQATIVYGSTALGNHLEFSESINAADNGVYNISQGLTIGNVIYKGSEEAVVNKGTILSCRKITCIGKGNNPLSLDDMVHTDVDHIHLVIDPFAATDADKSCNSIINLRSSNVSSGRLRVGKITGQIYGIQMIGIADTNGSIDSVEIGRMDIDYYYYSGTTNLSGWCNFKAAKQYNIGPCNIKFIDTTDTLLFNDRPQIVLPTTVTGKSFIKDVDMYATLADGTTKSPVEMRLANFAINGVHHSGLRMQTNIGPYGREVDYAPKNSVNSGSGVGSNGYWNKDEDYQLSTRTAAPFRVRVTASGDPATTVTY